MIVSATIILRFCDATIYSNLHNLQYNKCRHLDSRIKDVKFNMSLLDCIFECNSRTKCKSFVYHAQIHMCAFYNTDNETGVMDCGEHFVWYGAIENFSNLQKKCGNCRGKECPADYRNNSHITVIGNMNQEGTRRRLIDNSAGDTYVQKCDTGKWNEIPDTRLSLGASCCRHWNTMPDSPHILLPP